MSGLSPFPLKMFAKLPYCVEFATSANGSVGTTSGTEYVINLNDLFVPQQSSHQPYGFNTLESLYRRYMVRAVWIDVVATTTATDIMYPIIGIQQPEATFTSTALSSAASKCGEKPGWMSGMITYSGSNATMRYSRRFTMEQLTGLSRTQIETDFLDFSALCTASPARRPRLCCNNSSIAASGAVYWTAKLVYEAEFFERKTLTQST